MLNGMKLIGHITPKSSAEIASSRFGIGLEKIDRYLYDPTPVYDPLAQTGVKYVRIQSGWMRTEKEKGVYDWNWIDDIVDNLVSRGMEPWICLCYGNPIWSERAANVRGAIGVPPIFCEEEAAAWDRYVSECVKRYRGKVKMYEIWNEPDGKHCWRHGVNAAEYGKFVKRTSAAIRAADSEAKVLAGSFFSSGSTTYLHDFLKELTPGDIDCITYHQYRYRIEYGIEAFARGIRQMLDAFDPRVGIIQGETGTQSAFSRNGALCGSAWTERKQAKFLARKLLIDLKTEVEFTSWFTAVDIFENIINEAGTVNKEYYGFFGVLGETFAPDGTPLGKYEPKLSYTALRTICAALSEAETAELAVFFETSRSPLFARDDEDPYDPASRIIWQGFEKNGSKAFVYWKAADILTEEFLSTVSLRCFDLPGKIRFVDLVTGDVWSLDGMVTENGGERILSHIPVTDYPFMLTFGDFAEITPL